MVVLGGVVVSYARDSPVVLSTCRHKWPRVSYLIGLLDVFICKRAFEERAEAVGRRLATGKNPAA